MQILLKTEYCKIYKNEEFIYREYTVMQPLQRSYAITGERIEAMLSKGSLSSLYDQAKVDELENMEELSGKDLKKLENYQNNQPLYEAIICRRCRQQYQSRFMIHQKHLCRC